MVASRRAIVAAVAVAAALAVGVPLAVNGLGGADSDPQVLTRASPIADHAAFTIAVIPDTQYATEATVLPPSGETAFATQTRWLAENATALDLAFVLHEGDLVDDACKGVQWQRAIDAMANLSDAGIPYAISAGNHDVRYYPYQPDPCTDGPPVDHPADFISAFPLDAMAAQPTFGGSFSPTDGLNTFSTFTAGGAKYLVLALEFGPRAEVLDWALGVVRAHLDHHAILLTHDLIGPDGLLRGGGSTSDDALPKPPRLTGEEVWQRLVEPASTIELTLNGHVTEGIAGRSVADNAAGLPVYRLLANYQTLDDGQTGYLRLLTFHPDTGTVDVRTYSPVLDAYLTDAANEFTLTGLDLAP